MSAAVALRVDLTHLLGLRAPSRAERMLRALLAAAVVGCALLVLTQLVVAPLTGSFGGAFEDFGPLLSAGHAANTGADVYGGFVARSSSHLVTDLGFDYPPLVAFLLRPLAAMPHQVAVAAWLWTILASSVAGCILIAREVLPESWPRTAVGFCAAVCFAPVIYNVFHGQMNAVVFLTLALALRAWMRGDQVGCGIALGAGAALKVAPVALLVLLVRRRWWRGTAAAAATVAASLVAGGVLVSFDSVREWFTQVLPVLSRDDGWYFNQGWNAVVNRVADHDVFALEAPRAWIHPLVLAISAAGLVAAAWLVRTGAASPERRSLEFAAGVTAMVLAGTVSWYSAYIHLALPLLVVLGVLARREHLGRALAGGSIACLAISGLAVPLFLGAGGKDWVVAQHGTPMWWPALQVVSVPAYAAAGFLIVLLGALRRPQGRARLSS